MEGSRAKKKRTAVWQTRPDTHIFLPSASSSPAASVSQIHSTLPSAAMADRGALLSGIRRGRGEAQSSRMGCWSRPALRTGCFPYKGSCSIAASYPQPGAQRSRSNGRGRGGAASAADQQRAIGGKWRPGRGSRFRAGRPEHVERVFEAFYTTKSSGTGMGLSICRSIIDAHGGRLWAEANEPRGAIFEFTLPAVES
jgi:Histidine kinase-, DNA gyrase B-, and HSP90-like ATPase